MTDSRWKNLALEVIGCFVSALGLYSFAVAAGVPVTGVAVSVPVCSACLVCPLV